MTIDLHGHSLSAAHARLNQALASAWARDVRIMLIVTGKPPKSTSAGGGPRRGAIRGEIGHWLETSSYADRIASVRIAHQRHGGDGALYVILRRKKSAFRTDPLERESTRLHSSHSCAYRMPSSACKK